jgi:phage tail sheath gpL-like
LGLYAFTSLHVRGFGGCCLSSHTRNCLRPFLPTQTYDNIIACKQTSHPAHPLQFLIVYRYHSIRASSRKVATNEQNSSFWSDCASIQISFLFVPTHNTTQYVNQLNNRSTMKVAKIRLLLCLVWKCRFQTPFLFALI